MYNMTLKLGVFLANDLSRVHQPEGLHVTVVIDVFRASSTAAYVLEGKPKTYILTSKCEVIARLAKILNDPVIIGKSELDKNMVSYTIPNSPTRVKETEIFNRNVLHRSDAGGKGVLLSKQADIVLMAGLVNADATVNYIKSLKNPKVDILPMGHLGTTSSLEDEICTKYIKALLEGVVISLYPYLKDLREGPGSYFFGEDQKQYPNEDFDRCLELKRFNFAIKAEIKEDHAVLSRVSET